jgi:hypothetical protein
MRRAAGVLAFVIIGLTVVVSVPASSSSDTLSTVQVPIDLPGQNVPIVRQHTYRMAGRVRMVLFWVSRDNVGEGVIKWRAGGDDKAFELLIGTDPEIAPGHLNKWGYFIEHNRHTDSSIVGLISQGHERRPADVEAGRQADRRAFDTVRGRVVRGEARARVGTLYAESHFTSRNAPVVLERMLADRSLALKRLERSPDVRSGFLSSLAELMEASISGGTRRQVRYVHGDRLFDLRLLDTTAQPRFERDEQVFEDVIRARFETAEPGQSGTRFELVYGKSGRLAGVPIVISYQPKWWLHVDLVLQT